MLITEETMAEGWEEPEAEEDDLFHEVYVETATGYIYEVQQFDGFVLLRPASPNMYGMVVKMGYVEFSGRFHSFTGDPDDLRDYIRGANPDFIIG